jgi:hypothetical protein
MTDYKVRLPEPHEAQTSVLESAKRYNVLACGRRWGKDYLLDMIMIPALLNGKTIALVAPREIDTDKMVSRQLGYLSELVADKIISYNRRFNKIVNHLNPNGEIRIYTARNYESIRGSGLDLFVANEAGELSTMIDLVQMWEKTVRMTLVDRQGSAWLAGTPRGVNSFYSLYMRGVEGVRGWRSFNFSSYDNPTLSSEEIDAMIQEEKMDKASIEQEIYARFIQREGLVFTNIDKVCILEPTQAKEIAPNSCAIGVDIGGAQDYTAVSIMSIRQRPIREYALIRWRTPKIKTTEERLMSICEQYHPAKVIVEANAIGEYFYQQLYTRLASLRIQVEPLHTSWQSKPDLISGLRYAMETGNLLLTNDEAGQAELAAYSAKLRETGSYRYGVERSSGLHDDTVMARAIAYQAAERLSPGYQIRIRATPVTFGEYASPPLATRSQAVYHIEDKDRDILRWRK